MKSEADASGGDRPPKKKQREHYYTKRENDRMVELYRQALTKGLNKGQSLMFVAQELNKEFHHQKLQQGEHLRKGENLRQHMLWLSRHPEHSDIVAQKDQEMDVEDVIRRIPLKEKQVSVSPGILEHIHTLKDRGLMSVDQAYDMLIRALKLEK